MTAARKTFFGDPHLQCFSACLLNEHMAFDFAIPVYRIYIYIAVLV